MNFFDSANIALGVGLRGLAFGFAVYFLIKLACGMMNLSGLVRFGAMVGAVLLYLSPEAYHLAFPPDIVTVLSDPGAAPDGLWLAMKAKLWTVIIGQVVAFAVDKHFFPE